MTVESDASSFNDIVEFNSTDHNADSRVENRRSIRSSTSGSSNLISKDDEKHPSFAKIFISTRFFIAILVLGGVFCQYSAKLDLSVNIVCMVNSSAHGSTNITSTSDCERPNNSQTVSF
ncbi:hypothetical protein GJ496_005668 [Pomphorhynchus laevis]|nr:hypothetical protein GJ496_005668 [Pomphorhynchus laevis]